MIGVTSVASGTTLYSVTTLPTPEGLFYDFSALNNSGQLAATLYVDNPVSVHAGIYSGGQFHSLGALGGRYSQASGISDDGQVTGSFALMSDSNSQHAFLYSKGQMSDLGTLGGVNSHGLGVNNKSQVTGYSEVDHKLRDEVQHAFIYTNGKMIDLAPLSAPYSKGTSINEHGQITGFASVLFVSPEGYGVGFIDHAFIYSDGKVTDLGSLGGMNSDGRDINNEGEVTGASENSVGFYYAFVYSGGKMKSLGTLPGSTSSAGFSINDKGQVTGLAYINQTTDAFLWSNGVMQDLNDLIDPALNIHLAQGIDINNDGQIFARGSVGGNDEYVLTPVPEPGTAGLLVIPLLIAAFCGLRMIARRTERGVHAEPGSAV